MSRKWTSRDGVALLCVVGVGVAVFAACNLDDKNPPLQDEAPNRGGPQVVPVGAGPGTGGGGMGGGTTTTTTLSSQGGGGPIPVNCGCALSLAGVTCQDCFGTLCDPTACDNDATCSALYGQLIGGGCDQTCVEGILNMHNPTLDSLIACGCSNCGPPPGSGDCTTATCQ